MTQVKVYGADWCSMTKDSRQLLDKLKVNYQYTDIEEDAQAAQWVRAHNDGKERKPTIDIAGQVLSEPSDDELTEALRSHKLIS